MSTLFVRTLREDPVDAEVASHRLLVRAGYIRRAAPGGFSWLPLGWMVYRNVEEIVRAEMDAAGFQEVHFPALLPRAPYEATGRWTEYGDGLFRLKDRKGNDFLLAPTHEEMFTLLVKDLYSSYKDLPLVHLPDPDEVPRRGPAPGRPAARPRVRDEGLLQLRRRRRRAGDVVPAPPRGVHQDVRTARPAGRHRVGDVRGDGWVGERGVPRPDRGRRGHVRALSELRLLRQRRGGEDPGSAGRADRRTARGRRARHARDAHDPDARRPDERARRPQARRPRVDCRRHPEERRRDAASSRRCSRAARDRRARATATST